MIKTVYIFFGEADHKVWYLKKLAKGFTHCFSYEHQLLGGYDCFLRIENLYYTLGTDICFSTKKHLLDRFPHFKIIQITLEVNPLKKTFDFMPINCVSLVKKQLGLNKPFIITPYQLYNHLIKIGGKRI